MCRLILICFSVELREFIYPRAKDVFELGSMLGFLMILLEAEELEISILNFSVPLEGYDSD